MAYGSDKIVLPMAESDGQRQSLIKFLLELMYHLNQGNDTRKATVFIKSSPQIKDLDGYARLG